ncbi:hypothetical protein SDC9_195553 [bioreactor metagenome]|uniref:Uncharacterized protein n=1 Tax=bioreactor metagenome TaxID=1076179 RepID=A0A645IBV7_9ZZZZ
MLPVMKISVNALQIIKIGADMRRRFAMFGGNRKFPLWNRSPLSRLNTVTTTNRMMYTYISFTILLAFWVRRLAGVQFDDIVLIPFQLIRTVRRTTCSFDPADSVAQ